MRAIIDWWDSVELGVTQLAFPMQVLLAGLVLLPLCWWIAAAADRLLGSAIAVASRRLAARRGAPPR